MKYFLLFIFFINSITRVHSQSVRFYTGARIEDNDDESFHLIDQDSLYLYAFHYKWQNYFVDVYEKDSLKKTALIKIPLPSKDTCKYTLESLFIRGDTFQIFYSYFDKKNSCGKLYMTTFNRGGEKIGETKLIDKSDGKNAKKAGGFSVINRKIFNEFLSYGYKYSNDTSYINIDHFDYAGNKTGTQNFSLGIDSEYVVHSSIDDDCNLYDLTTRYVDGKVSKWNVRVYSPNNNHPQIIELKQPSSEKIYLSYFFRSYFDKQCSYNLLSPYGLTALSQKAEGIYIAQLDYKTHAVIKESIIPFKVHSENGNNTNGFSTSSSIIMARIPMSDNRTKIVIESRLAMPAAFADKDYYIGNIITVDLDSSNAVTEIHNIKKQQNTGEPDYKFTGFAILNSNNKSYFIYNELPDNLQRTPDKMKKVTPARMNETTVIYALADSGKVQRKILINKTPNSGMDAIFPNSYLTDFDKSKIYLLRKIKYDIYLTKIYVE